MSHEHAPLRMGAVAVDVGPGRGALIVRTGAELGGTELEISPAAEPARRQHVWVLERGTGAYAAVFGSLPAGEYTVWCEGGGSSSRVVRVREGAVVEVDCTLQASPPPSRRAPDLTPPRMPSHPAGTTGRTRSRG